MIFNIMRVEMKQQLKSVIFWICVILFIISTYQEMSYVFYLPVKTEKDIKSVQKYGYRGFLYVDRNEKELREYVIYRFKELSPEDFSNITYEGSKYDILIRLGKKMDKEGLSISQVIDYIKKENDAETAAWIEKWIEAFMDNGKEKLGNVEQVNENLRCSLKGKPYTRDISMQYADLSQVVGSLLMLPLFVLLFSKDKRYHMNELIHSKQVKSYEYVLGRYFGCFLPFIICICIIGIFFNTVVCVNFARANWNINFFDIIFHILIYILPSLIFASALIVTLSLVLPNSMAVIPIYIFYDIFNITQGAFTGKWSNFSVALYKYIVRWNKDFINPTILLNRIIYIILAVILFFISCKVWRKADLKVKKVI